MPDDVTGVGTDADEADADLSAAVEGLLRFATGSRSLEDSLTWIATMAVLAVPGAHGVGITMHEDGRSQTVCATDDFVRRTDDVQYGLDEGPCVTAVTEARTTVSGDLGHEPRWPRFGPRAQRLGVHSVLSLPLTLASGEVLGALNVYSHDLDAFDAHAVGHGESFAVPAAVAVANARQYLQSHRLAEQLHAALGSRATIDQAIGILLSRQGGTPEQAFATLKQWSQRRNVKLAVVAAGVVDEAVARARARHPRET